MHLAGVDCGTALAVAGAALPARSRRRSHATTPSVHRQRSSAAEASSLQLPVPDDRLAGSRTQYLTRAPSSVGGYASNRCFNPASLYADHRGNAVFVLVAGKAKRPVGAELRGTGPRAAGAGWRPAPARTWDTSGSAPSGAREIVLCESAIDAISCFQMHPERICISTSGVRANPPWLRGLIAHGYAHPLRLRRRRPRRRRRRPHDRPPSHRPTPAATRPRLERRPRPADPSLLPAPTPPPVPQRVPHLAPPPATSQRVSRAEQRWVSLSDPPKCCI